MELSTAVARRLAVGMFMVFAGAAAAQQAYPNKPIRMITPYAPGGGTDILARIIGPKLSESWGQQVIVDHRPGGNTIIGSEALVKSPPDGYTIMLTTSTHVSNPSLIPNLPYDTVKDFAPVATLTRNEYVLVIHPSVPADNLQEFIALAKSRPGQLNFASSGTGSLNHLVSELFCIMTGTKIQHIPYKGGGPGLTDLVGGQVQGMFSSPIGVFTQIRSGRLKVIAISGETRSPTLPQVPTFTEAGLPGFEVRYWNGIFAPAGTPKEIIDKLSTEIAKILVMPDTKEKLAAQGVEPFISTPEQLAALVKADMAKFARIVKAANVKIEK